MSPAVAAREAGGPGRALPAAEGRHGGGAGPQGRGLRAQQGVQGLPDEVSAGRGRRGRRQLPRPPLPRAGRRGPASFPRHDPPSVRRSLGAAGRRRLPLCRARPRPTGARPSGEGEAGPEVPRGWVVAGGARRGAACRPLGWRRLSVSQSASRPPHPEESGLDLEARRRGLKLPRQLPAPAPSLSRPRQPAAPSSAGRGWGQQSAAPHPGREELRPAAGGSGRGNRCRLEAAYCGL